MTDPAGSAPFDRLDFLYVPSGDVAGDVATFEDVLGGTVVFAVESMGTRVAAVRLTERPAARAAHRSPRGDRPILVYRVPDLGEALAELEGRGWRRERTFEIPHGPICSFEMPGGHRVALYQLTRPEVGAHFDGRRDF